MSALPNLAEDKTRYEAADINRETAEAYDRLLDNLLITEATPAWWTNRLKRLVKVPGIVAAVLRLDRAEVRREAPCFTSQPTVVTSRNWLLPLYPRAAQTEGRTPSG